MIASNTTPQNKNKKTETHSKIACKTKVTHPIEIFHAFFDESISLDITVDSPPISYWENCHLSVSAWSDSKCKDIVDKASISQWALDSPGLGWEQQTHAHDSYVTNIVLCCLLLQEPDFGRWQEDDKNRGAKEILRFSVSGLRCLRILNITSLLIIDLAKTEQG